MTSVDPYIAVVDDELAVRTTLRRTLGLAGFSVTTFASGEAFLPSLDARRPLCAIIDVHMPGLTGLQVQERLRAAAVEIPVVLITASDELSLDTAARNAGAVCLLRKPFPTDDLLKAIADVTGRR